MVRHQLFIFIHLTELFLSGEAVLAVALALPAVAVLCASRIQRLFLTEWILVYSERGLAFSIFGLLITDISPKFL